MNKPRFHKRIRLPSETYAVPGLVWHVTTTVLDRRPVFREPDMAHALVDALQFQCRKAGADLLLYCVMPDHVHALVAVEELDLISVI
jgi:REP element-mobilizing transposase RayT